MGIETPNPSPAPPRYTPIQLGLVFVLACLGLLLLVSAFAVFGLYRQGTRAIDRAGEVLGGGLDIGGLGSLTAQPTPTIVTKAVLVQKLAGASELTTAIYTMETVIDQSQDRTLAGIVIGQTKLLYIAHGEVRAGVNLARLTPEDISVISDTITIRLPPPEILDKKIDVEKSYVYDMDRSLLGPVDPAMQTRAERFALDKILRGACEGGILREANQRAETAVKALLGAQAAGDRSAGAGIPIGPTGLPDVRVVTRAAAAGTCPEAAEPTP